MNKEAVIISVIAVVAVTVLEALALKVGIDGTALAAGLAIIGGIAGYQIKKVRG